MNKMIVSNLAYRPMRSIISIVAVAVEVTLILLIVGLALGILTDNKARTAGVGADIMVRPPGSGPLTALSGAPMPVKLAEVIRKRPHVVAVAPVFAQVTSGGSLEFLNGIDPASFQAVGGPFRFLSGGSFEGQDDMIVDDIYASANHLHPGSVVEALNHQFHIVGVIPAGRGARRYVQLSTLQDLTGAQGKASIFYVRLDDSKLADIVSKDLKGLLPGYSIMSMKEWLSLMSSSNIPGLATFIDVVIGIAVIIGFIVIFQSMYTAVMERTREIGILKSLGASKAFIIRLILREALLLAICGILLGMLISTVGRAGLMHKFPTLMVLPISWDWGLKATGIAIVGALLGAVWPAYKAAQKDPIDALAYE